MTKVEPRKTGSIAKTLKSRALPLPSVTRTSKCLEWGVCKKVDCKRLHRLNLSPSQNLRVSTPAVCTAPSKKKSCIRGVFGVDFSLNAGRAKSIICTGNPPKCADSSWDNDFCRGCCLSVDGRSCSIAVPSRLIAAFSSLVAERRGAAGFEASCSFDWLGRALCCWIKHSKVQLSVKYGCLQMRHSKQYRIERRLPSERWPRGQSDLQWPYCSKL